MIAQLSDRTLATLLTARMRAGRVFQLFARKLGPKDSVHAVARAWDADGNQVEIVSHAIDLEQALVEILRNVKALAQTSSPEVLVAIGTARDFVEVDVGEEQRSDELAAAGGATCDES